jgi:hypothetical protein
MVEAATGVRWISPKMTVGYGASMVVAKRLMVSPRTTSTGSLVNVMTVAAPGDGLTPGG